MYIHQRAKAVSAFPPPPPPARAEGKSVPATGDKSAGPHGAMGVGFPPALVDAVWGVAACYTDFLILLGL